MKEAMARDEARISWLKEGDRNTAFFHAAIRVRRKQNSMTPQRNDGIDTTNSSDIVNEALLYYQTLFNKYTPPPSNESMKIIENSVTDQIKESISGIPDKNKIKEALYGMNCDGAPGPGGFSVPFYMFSLDIIQNDLISAIQDFFQGVHLYT